MSFPGSTGATLEGALHVPDGGARGSVLMAHCFTCSKDLHTMTRLATGLADAGYAALRFDFTGIGSSGGDFAGKTVANNVRDLVAAATALIAAGYGPCGMLGHSLGGAAVLLAAAKIKTARSLVTLGAPATANHVCHLLEGSVEDIRREGVALVSIGGRPFPISAAFVDELDRHDDTGHIGTLGRPLLVLHAVDDETVPVEQGEMIFAAARQPKAFVPLLDTDHLVSGRAQADVVLHEVVRWFDRTL